MRCTPAAAAAASAAAAVCAVAAPDRCVAAPPRVRRCVWPYLHPAPLAQLTGHAPPGRHLRQQAAAAVSTDAPNDMQLEVAGSVPQLRSKWHGTRPTKVQRHGVFWASRPCCSPTGPQKLAVRGQRPLSMPLQFAHNLWMHEEGVLAGVGWAPYAVRELQHCLCKQRAHLKPDFRMSPGSRQLAALDSRQRSWRRSLETSCLLLLLLCQRFTAHPPGGRTLNEGPPPLLRCSKSCIAGAGPAERSSVAGALAGGTQHATVVGRAKQEHARRGA